MISRLAATIALVISFTCVTAGVAAGPSRSSSRLVLVIDVSGSMRGGKLTEAMNAAANIALGPTDDLEVGIILFNSEPRRLRNPTDNNSEWFLLPSLPVAQALERGLDEVAAGGTTTPDDALRQAYETPQAQLIVLITDGLFNVASAITALREAQSARERAGLSYARFVAFGVQCSDEGEDKLRSLVADGRGQLWLPAPPEPEKETKTAPSSGNSANKHP